MTSPCELCRGACCESFAVPLPYPAPVEFNRWAKLRGEVVGHHLRVEVPCTALTDDGACGIYKSRPQPCKDYPMGGPACRQAVRDRRSDRADEIFASMDAWETSRSPGPPRSSNTS